MEDHERNEFVAELCSGNFGLGVEARGRERPVSSANLFRSDRALRCKRKYPTSTYKVPTKYNTVFFGFKNKYG